MTEDDRPTRDAPPHQTWALPRAALPFVPGYRLVAEIRRGGQGTVYEGVQESTGRSVAVKVLAEPASSGVREQARFEREVEALCGLDHPGVVQVFDSGVADGRHFLVMPLVRGVDVATHVRDRALSLRGRLELFARICEAVHHAHQRGVLHRDLKPANILVDAEGRPHVLDFGLARPLSGEAGLTLTGVFAGTLTHAAPEQVAGTPSALDVRTDVYALGVVLFQLLTGRLPFDVPLDLASAVRVILSEEPRPPSSLAAGLDRDLDTIVKVALAKDKERRYASVDALRADVERYLRHEPLEARRDSAWYVLHKNAWRHRRVLAAAAAVVLALLASLVVALQQRGEAVRLALEAERQAARAEDEAEGAARVRDLVTSVVVSLSKDAARASPGDAIRDAAARVRDELADRPEARRRALGHLESTLRLLGRPADSLELARDVRRLALEAHGAASVEYLDALRAEWQARGMLGHGELADRLAAKGFAIARRMNGREPEAEMTWWQIRAVTLARAGRLEEAREAFRGGLELLLSQAQPRRGTVAQQRINLALVEGDLGHPEEAMSQLRAVIDENAEVDEIEPQVAFARRLLAQGLLEARRPAEAEPLLRASIEVATCLSQLSPESISGLLSLGDALGQLGRHDEALGALEEAALRAEAGAGVGSQLRGSALHSMAIALRRAGRHEEAEALHRLVHAEFFRHLSDRRCSDHAGNLRDWAESRLAAGDANGARELAAAALQVMEGCPELSWTGRRNLERVAREAGVLPP